MRKCKKRAEGTLPRDVVPPHYSYQPSRKKLQEDPRVDASFDEVVAACLQPVKIRYVKPPKRKG